MPDMTERSDVRPRRRKASPSPPGLRGHERQVKKAAAVRPTPDDRFFRHIVSSMRNGVIAFRRDGTLALMNAEAYRIFGLTPSAADVGRSFADVLSGRTEIIRVLAGACELSHQIGRASCR